MPWGADNEMPYKILDLIEQDETLSTCLLWNAQMCYGNGLEYVTDGACASVKEDVDEWLLDNQLPSFFLGMAHDLKYWGFAITVFVLSNSRKKIARVLRKEAMYCRFAPADKTGRIDKVLYANWRNTPTEKEIEVIPLLDEYAPLADLRSRKCGDKFAVLTRIPTADHTYYPIPYWASILRSKWYNIKRLIAVAKESKIKNTAPLKYHVEISDKYFDRIFKREHITDPKKQVARVAKEKQQILDFLTGAENSGKTWFSNFYVTPDGKEQHEVVVTRIDSTKEGGDWETDVQEAVNMICFTLQVHSNLVGSVPGKSQTNNSGSDKRELYTIAQALQKPYHDLMFVPHNMIIRYNEWKDVTVRVPFIKLTTLDENTDSKMVTLE
ncbi:MAG: hypothetical protein IJM66_11520 [Muribaculaceae bacterium]|nr:hypothetical protein [Muribaculaceae bacterium]MBQ6649461.1 hypothetical protein [Muribaculaceae bacterium]